MTRSLLSDLGTGVVVFASTNIDDIFLLAAFFSDPHIRHRSIVAGQYLGIGVLVVVSAVAALLALALPEGWIALMGIVPLLLGLHRLITLRTDADRGNGGAGLLQGQERAAERGFGSQVVAVAGVTVANGGDNIGVYVPLFATVTGAIVTYAFTFAVMTGVWCALGHLLVHHTIAGSAIRRYGHAILPLVLIGLGLYLLSGAMFLFR